MNFIDKLEAFLLRPTANVYYSTSENGLCFNLGCHRESYQDIQDIDVKKAGIKSMMAALRDNHYKDPIYHEYLLDLIGWDYFEDILKLEPSHEDLFNLYKVTGYSKGKKLVYFLLKIDDKEWRIKFLKQGCSYSEYSKLLRQLTEYMDDMSDDEWMDAFSAYIKNSNNAIQKEGINELAEIFIHCIKDTQKCERFIFETLGIRVKFESLFEESNVTQLTLESKTSLKHFDCQSDYELNNYLKCFSTLLTYHTQDVGEVDKIDYYKSGLTYNFLFYNDHDNKARELTKRLLMDTLPLLKNMGTISTQTIIENFSDDFTKLISHHSLEMSMSQKNQQIKIQKI